MNIRVIENWLKFIFIILSAYIAADILNTYGKGEMYSLPEFNMPEKVIKKNIDKPSSTSAPPNAWVNENEFHKGIPSVKLIGTITGSHPYAVILDLASNKQELYRLRDDIDGWTLFEIMKNKIVLKRNEIKELLEVKFIDADPKAETPAAPVMGVKLDPRDVEGALADLNKVMTQARVVPNMVDGKTSGYRIFNIVSDSIYNKLGLRNNDIVERVNGVEIKSPDTLYQLFQQIKNETRITLDITRSGKKESIPVEIR